MVNIVFGSGGTIGSSLHKLLSKKKNFIFYSKKENKNKKILSWNLNKNLINFPYKKIDTIFFFSSPYFIKKNYKKKTVEQEYKWLENVINNLNFKKIVYLSSSSVFYKKDHLIKSTKIKCENLIKKKNLSFNYFQIWRPFNIVSSQNYISDHFHNLLTRKMFNEGKTNFTFQGSGNDKRGYSDAYEFVKVLFLYSKKNISFIKNYGNKDIIKMSDIVDIFNNYYTKIYGRIFRTKFLSKNYNVSKVDNSKNSIYSTKPSRFVLSKFIKDYLHEKKMFNLQKSFFRLFRSR
jgi:nucleoside-diphosphate-sugar epimerase